jgi:hypothetical protein
LRLSSDRREINAVLFYCVAEKICRSRPVRALVGPIRENRKDVHPFLERWTKGTKSELTLGIPESSVPYLDLHAEPQNCV